MDEPPIPNLFDMGPPVPIVRNTWRKQLSYAWLLPLLIAVGVAFWKLGYLGYFLISLPNVFVLAAALMLALFPKWVLQLEENKPLRLVLALALGLLSIVIWVTTAVQLRTSESDSATLSAKVADLRGQVESLTNSQTHAFEGISEQLIDVVKVPKLAVEISGDQYATLPTATGWMVGVNLTITNSGDDASYTTHYVSALTSTPNPAQRSQIVNTIYKKLGDLNAAAVHEKRSLLRHGESATTSSFATSDYNMVMGMAYGIDTGFFGEVVDIKTAAGKHDTIYYCVLYQGLMLVHCK